ncbi:uncharacterized protein LOC106461530 [Limulus polyphemus]|uniref:nicotinamidase n=1 Tax=Limulus polyphemus TaxID=6850 RepID=A0ABM1SKS5_LIMPO|nr:uncharacterized protein LOC106461530 [Limulus polyphemus]
MNNDNFFCEYLRNGLRNKDEEALYVCFDYFDIDRDGCLNMKEFGNLAKSLLSDRSGRPYPLSIRMQADMFFVFDRNKDGKIDMEEFKIVWKDWIKVILHPVSALIIVDVQNDFISGTLAIRNCPAGQDGLDVVNVINSMLNSVPFDVVIYSLDWHPPDHVSFIDNLKQRKVHADSKVSAEDAKLFDTVIFEGPPRTEQKLWPRHCVQHTWGAELHPDLKVVRNGIRVYKGINSNIDSYSAFWDNQKMSETKLGAELRKWNVGDVYICGLAYDVCVGSTALHALEHGYRTVVVDDASRGVNMEEIAYMQKTLISRNAVVVTSDKVRDMVEGLDRRPEMGYRAALRLANDKVIV